MSDMRAPDFERPASAPVEGQIPAFDAGWHCQRLGMARETVAVVAHPSGRDWALLGYDVRAKMELAPDPWYSCGAAYCDDPACTTHNHDHPNHPNHSD